MSARKDNRMSNYVITFDWTTADGDTSSYRSQVYDHESAWDYTLHVIKHAHRASVKLSHLRVRRFNKKLGNTVWSTDNLAPEVRREVFKQALHC